MLQGCMPLPPISGRSRARVDCEARGTALSTLWTFSISRLFGKLLSANSMSCCIISHLKRFDWSLPLHDHKSQWLAWFLSQADRSETNAKGLGTECFRNVFAPFVSAALVFCFFNMICWQDVKKTWIILNNHEYNWIHETHWRNEYGTALR